MSVDTRDAKVSEMLYRLIFSETYIYRDFKERADDQQQPMNVAIQTRLMEYLMKFEVSASQSPYNQKLVFHCFFSNLSQRLEAIGLAFISKFFLNE